jgi:hypothetical protein
MPAERPCRRGSRPLPGKKTSHPRQRPPSAGREDRTSPLRASRHLTHRTASRRTTRPGRHRTRALRQGLSPSPRRPLGHGAPVHPRPSQRGAAPRLHRLRRSPPPRRFARRNRLPARTPAATPEHVIDASRRTSKVTGGRIAPAAGTRPTPQKRSHTPREERRPAPPPSS